MYQGSNALDSILNFPTYTALVQAFMIPGPQNMSALIDVMQQSKAKFQVGLVALSNSLRSDLPLGVIIGRWSPWEFPRKSGFATVAQYIGGSTEPLVSISSYSEKRC